MIQEKLIKIKTSDQAHVALWKIQPSHLDPSKQVFLTHGTFSDKQVLLGISRFLAEQGYTCWIMEWRNHGASSLTTAPFNFETIALNDIPPVFEYLSNTVGLKQWTCITHSGGGILLTMFLIKNPQYQSFIHRITFFACQAFGAANSWKQYSVLWLGKYFSALLGKIPASKAGAKAHDEQYFTMKQWFDWNLNKNFLGKDQFDYLAQMNSIKIPILSICGGGDRFIAPKSGCEKFLLAFQNPANQLMYFSIKNGHKENYNHSRILLSRNAQTEVWPKVLDWITIDLSF